jgi:Leucine-rich repeat (LRR) protein
MPAREQVPESIAALGSLRELNLADNDLSALPPALGALAPGPGGGQLHALHLQGNAIRSIRRAVLDKGTQAVLEHLRARMLLQSPQDE